jgi:hypothetical protein
MVSRRRRTCLGLLGWRTGVELRVPAALMAAAAALMAAAAALMAAAAAARVSVVRLASSQPSSQTGGCHVSVAQCTGRWQHG